MTIKHELEIIDVIKNFLIQHSCIWIPPYFRSAKVELNFLVLFLVLE